LGVAGGGDTAADTAIDLLVYVLKYRVWLHQQGIIKIEPNPGATVESEFDLEGDITDSAEPANILLAQMQGTLGETLLEGDASLALDAKALFKSLENFVQNTDHRVVDTTTLELAEIAYDLAYRLWYKE